MGVNSSEMTIYVYEKLSLVEFVLMEHNAQQVATRNTAISQLGAGRTARAS